MVEKQARITVKDESHENYVKMIMTEKRIRLKLAGENLYISDW